MHIALLHNKNPQLDTDHNFRLTLLARDVFDAFASSWREDMVRQKAPGWCFFRFFSLPSLWIPSPYITLTPRSQLCGNSVALVFTFRGKGLFDYSIPVRVCLLYLSIPALVVSSFIHLHLWDGWAMLGDTECPWRFHSFVEAWAEFSQNHRGIEVQTCQILEQEHVR